MELQDQFVSREEAIVQRDYHQAHADQWLGHLILGASAGNGGGLLALGAFVAAREVTGPALIVSGLAAVAFFVGLASSTYSAALVRHQALMFRTGYNGIVQQQDYAKHFPQEGEGHEVMKNGLSDNTHHAFNSGSADYNPLNRASSFFVWSFLIGTILTAVAVGMTATSPVSSGDDVLQPPPASTAAPPAETLPSGETPATIGDTPAPIHETPAPISDTAAPTVETPERTVEAPAPTGTEEAPPTE